jgi:hypothetical protein
MLNADRGALWHALGEMSFQPARLSSKGIEGRRANSAPG